ncbi:hypothetical protein HKX48_001846 [Thoreauomyces humboldtii]|nr:hypothetical protein HKX48_001846 [Thoreauomyces humboldtii]
MTLVVACSADEGFISSAKMYGRFNAAKFEEFMKVALGTAAFHRPRTVIMDNTRIHRREAFNELFYGEDEPDVILHRLQLLPTYSPYLNVAEWVFGSVKPYVKKQDIDKEVQRNYILALQGEKLGHFHHNRSILRLAQFQNGDPGDDSDSGEDSGGDNSAGDDAPVEEEEEGADDDEDDSA